MSYSVGWHDTGTYIQFYGAVSVDDVFAADHEQQNDARFPDINYQIADFTGAESTSVALGDVKLPAAFDAAACQLNSQLKVALIVGDSIARKMCEEYKRFLNAINASWQIALFDNYEDAYRWCQD